MSIVCAWMGRNPRGGAFLPEVPPGGEGPGPGLLERAGRRNVSLARTPYHPLELAFFGAGNVQAKPVGVGPLINGGLANPFMMDSRPFADPGSLYDYLYPIIIVQETQAAHMYNSTIDQLWTRR